MSTHHPVRPTHHPVMSTKCPTSVWFTDAPTHPEQDCQVLLGDLRETAGHFPVLGTFKGVIACAANGYNAGDAGGDASHNHFKMPLAVPRTDLHTITINISPFLFNRPPLNNY